MSRVHHVQKNRDRKQRMDIGKYSLVIGPLNTGTNWLQKYKGISLVKLRFLETELESNCNERNRSVAKIIYKCSEVR